MDMEIHFVHFAGGDAKPDFASALGLMFSVDNPDPISSDLKAKVDAFLDAIKDGGLSGGTPDSAASDISFNDQVHNLLTALDWNNRWGYSGSLTTPPCNTGVYHNVLRQILPVSLVQMNAIKSFTATNAANFYTETEGNFRRIQPLNSDTAAVLLTSSPTTVLDELKDSPYLGGFIAFLVLFILFMIGFIIACYGWMAARSAAADNEDKEVELGATN